jgi:hypothetical protein
VSLLADTAFVPAAPCIFSSRRPTHINFLECTFALAPLKAGPVHSSPPPVADAHSYLCQYHPPCLSYLCTT